MLKCPVCQKTMVTYKENEETMVSVEICPHHGVWLDEGELGKIFNITHELGIQAHPTGHYDPQGKRCPRDNILLIEWQWLKNIKLDRCSICHGFWLDKGEWKRIKNELS